MTTTIYMISSGAPEGRSPRPGEAITVKIGASNRLERRLRDLQGGSPVALRIEDSWPCPAHREAQLKHLLSPYKLARDWYRAPWAVLSVAWDALIYSTPLGCCLPTLGIPEGRCEGEDGGVCHAMGWTEAPSVSSCASQSNLACEGAS